MSEEDEICGTGCEAKGVIVAGVLRVDADGVLMLLGIMRGMIGGGGDRS